MTLGAKNHTDLGTNFDDKVDKTWPGQATWAGTSEVGGQCHQCGLWAGNREKHASKGACRKYAELTKTVLKKCPKFTGDALACRYMQKVAT